jgi:uncharacterized RDD family membrane protein YckC
MSTAPHSPADWPGKKFGLPESGARSVARAGRRILALVLDWVIASVLSLTLVPQPQDDGSAAWAATNPFATLGIFAVLQVLFIATAGGSIGHLIFGMRVVPLSPSWVGIVKPIARTVLLCLAIPAVIWDHDQRGMHDRLVGTVLVRR